MASVANKQQQQQQGQEKYMGTGRYCYILDTLLRTILRTILPATQCMETGRCNAAKEHRNITGASCSRDEKPKKAQEIPGTQDHY
eukprot:1157966-Pelagomonas_calceolata.AAC.2